MRSPSEGQRDFKVSYSERNGVQQFQKPPEGERQGTKKLIDWLLKVNPQACTMEDSSGHLFLQLAIETGKVWGNGVASLVSG
jgi:hypothetical protein